MVLLTRRIVRGFAVSLMLLVCLPFVPDSGPSTSSLAFHFISVATAAARCSGPGGTAPFNGQTDACSFTLNNGARRLVSLSR
ncbi:MAG: hypothetical protein ACR2PL_23735 [Dehalococcoidia bacterium]